MAKSDFECAHCGVVSESLTSKINPFDKWHKYTCSNCGTICESCAKDPLIGACKCRHCGAKVLKYVWEDGKWARA